MPKVFISYSHQDQAFAKRLDQALDAEGVDVFIDERDFQIGDSIPQKIGRAIDTSDFVIAVLSSSSVKSGWVLTELQLAMTKEVETHKKSVLPIKIENCEVPSFLKSKLYADFTDPDNFYEPFYELLRALAVADNHDRCEHCMNRLPLSFSRCPHCARPAPSPNVRAAKTQAERETLDMRYESALKDAASRGCGEIVRRFESVLADAKVVIVCSMSYLTHLSTSDKFFTFLNPHEAESSAPREEEQIARDVSNHMLFGGYESEIRYGVLSLDGIGVSNYGLCSLVLRENMVAYRTSLLEDNSVRLIEKHGLRVHDRFPMGYRAAWRDRNKLCVAKLARHLTSQSQPSDFPGLLLHQGKTFSQDRFIEAHVWGTITMRTVERVVIQGKRLPRSDQAVLTSLRQKLRRMNVTIDLR